MNKNSDALKEVQHAIDAVLEENARMKRALVELDTGGGNYMTSRADIAKLSGLPMMGATWGEHIKRIEEKLSNVSKGEHPSTPEAR
jgi:hypothetical protein